MHSNEGAGQWEEKGAQGRGSRMGRKSDSLTIFLRAPLIPFDAWLNSFLPHTPPQENQGKNQINDLLFQTFVLRSTSTIILITCSHHNSHGGTIHSPELWGQEQVFVPSLTWGAWFHSHCLNSGRFPLWVYTTLAAMSHDKEYAYCFCLKWDCKIFQKCLALCCRVFEEGRVRAYFETDKINLIIYFI